MLQSFFPGGPVIHHWLCQLGRRPAGAAGRGAILVLAAQIVSFTILGAGISRADLVIDPEVRALVRSGRARVLVMLQVGDNGNDAQRADAISRAQDSLLSRLPQPHASVMRRFTSIPVLALEIDATALLALETMTDLVVAVKSDRPLAPQ
jgi:hypothetical protein